MMDRLNLDGRHHILVFLTGQEEIEAMAKSARTIAKVSVPKSK